MCSPELCVKVWPSGEEFNKLPAVGMRDREHVGPSLCLQWFKMKELPLQIPFTLALESSSKLNHQAHIPYAVATGRSLGC